MEETFDTQKAISAQREYCRINNAPEFAPLRTGICYSCRQNIFQKDRGYSVERAGRELITGCPFCHHSYCD